LTGDVRAFTTTYNSIARVLKSKVKISTAFDPSKHPPPQPFEFEAIWDTGASSSVISGQVVNRCGLQPTGMAKVYTANGESLCNTYLVCVMLPNGLGFPTVRVTEGKLAGADALIGMDIIGRGDFSVSNFEGKTVLAFPRKSGRLVKTLC